MKLPVMRVWTVPVGSSFYPFSPYCPAYPRSRCKAGAGMRPGPWQNAGFGICTGS